MADLNLQASEPGTRQSTPASPYVPFLWYGVLLAVSFGPVLGDMFYQWQTDEDMGHGFFVPLIAGYVFWECRRDWLGQSPAFARWGIAVTIWGALQLWLGTIGAEIFLQRSAFLVTAVGITLFYGGGPLLRKLAFPFLLLLFMIPIPGIVYKQITFPLQLLASALAETILDLAGYMVVREGNVLELAGQTLSVVEACSGLRALHSLSFFSLSYAYLFDARPWMRWFLLACTPPVAIIANAGRVVLTGVLGEYDKELAAGLYHTASGWSLFVIALLLLMGIHKLTRFAEARRA